MLGGGEVGVPRGVVTASGRWKLSRNVEAGRGGAEVWGWEVAAGHSEHVAASEASHRQEPCHSHTSPETINRKTCQPLNRNK